MIKRSFTSTTVIKLGGSVLTGVEAYERCAAHLHDALRTDPLERIVVVVSAQFGTTDRLLALAQEFTPTPDQAALDLLWSTGELRSVALLTLALQRLGVKAAGLNVHECGLHSLEGVGCASAVTVRTETLRRFLEHHDVVVVPGFFASGPFESVVSLGRGASDLTAILLAAALDAERCELVKDVTGYYDKDPNRFSDAAPLPRVTFAQAMEMAAAGCDLVQPAALEAARRHRCPVVVRCLDAAAPGTIVSDEWPVVNSSKRVVERGEAAASCSWRRVGA